MKITEFNYFFFYTFPSYNERTGSTKILSNWQNWEKNQFIVSDKWKKKKNNETTWILEKISMSCFIWIWILKYDLIWIGNVLIGNSC